MNNITELDNLTRAARRREFDDGLMDLVYGAVFFVISLLCWLAFSPNGLRWYITAMIRNRELSIVGLVGAISALALLFGLAKRGVEKLRRTVIWVDQGTVKPLRWQVDRPVVLLAVGVTIGIIFIALGLMTVGITGPDVVLRALVTATGVGTGIVYTGMGIGLALPRYKWVGTIGGALSGLILFSPLSFPDSWLLVGFLWLALLFTSGIWALRRSLQSLKEQTG